MGPIRGMDGEQNDASDVPSRGKQPGHIFLSYSRNDKPLASEIVELLQSKSLMVWWDDLLEGGERFHEAIEHNLERSTAVVVLWSASSVKSHWVRDEAERGREWCTARPTGHKIVASNDVFFVEDVLHVRAD